MDTLCKKSSTITSFKESSMKKTLSYLACLILLICLTYACASPPVKNSGGNEEVKAQKGYDDLDKETEKESKK